MIPNSLWNTVYVPLIDLIDKKTASFDNGYDAWVFVPEDNSFQTVLGAAYILSSFGVNKVDEDNKALAGAVFEVYDDTGKLVDSWTSDGNEHTVSNIYTSTIYKIHEKTPPAGYRAIEDIYVVVDMNGKVTAYSTEPEEEGSDHKWLVKEDKYNDNNAVAFPNAKTQVSVKKTGEDNNSNDSGNNSNDSGNSSSSSGSSSNPSSKPNASSNGGNNGGGDNNPATGVGGAAIPAAVIVVFAALTVRKKSKD